MPTAIAICDQVELFREGVARVLDLARFRIVRSVRSVRELVEIPTETGALDLIVIGVGDDSSFDHILPLLLSWGEGAPMVVILATSPTRSLILSAMSSGIRAVLPKDISGVILAGALELVLLGHKFFSAYDDVGDPVPEHRLALPPAAIPAVVDRLLIRLPMPDGDDDIQLSEREEQILCRLVAGAPNKTIARDLTITDATVKVHIKGLLRKLRVTNRTQAAVWGLNHGFGDSRPSRHRANGAEMPLNGIHAPS